MVQLRLGTPYGGAGNARGDNSHARHAPEARCLGIVRDSGAPISDGGAVGDSGRHVRVDLEDNLCIGRGVFATSNAALVERAAMIVKALGHRPRYRGDQKGFGLKQADATCRRAV